MTTASDHTPLTTDLVAPVSAPIEKEAYFEFLPDLAVDDGIDFDTIDDKPGTLVHEKNRDALHEAELSERVEAIDE